MTEQRSSLEKTAVDDTIIPAQPYVELARSGPYRNTSRAVAELIDNSADAKATEIGIALIVDENGRQPHTIAVLDNGKGMDLGDLKHCLQYGYHGGDAGEDSGGRRRQRLGKFGVGLLAASFSQAREVSVMSWQNNEVFDGGQVPSTGLSLDDDTEVLAKNRLPNPERKALPAWAGIAFDGMTKPITAMNKGTLVIWSGVDTRNRAATLQEQLVWLCGRIHRELLKYNALSIVINVYDEHSKKSEPRAALPVDPMFLEHWPADELKDWGFSADRTLFQPFTGHHGDTGRSADGGRDGYPIYVPHGSSKENAVGVYILNSSYRSDFVTEDPKLTRTFREPGDAPYGKLAHRLRGVSILRAGREIDLDPNWLREDKTVDRWVSVSVDFDTELDDIFGISNDKQQARGLAGLASRPIEDLRADIRELEKDGAEEDSVYLERLKIAWKIKDQLRQMQRAVRLQKKDDRRPKSGPDTPTDPTLAPTSELVTVGERMVEGDRPLSMDTKEPSEDHEGTVAAYGDSMSGDKLAKDVRPEEVEAYNLKLDYSRDVYGTPAEMFHIAVGNHMVVHFHQKHPISDVLAKLLVKGDPDEAGDPPTMQDALRVVRSLVVAFARLMAEADQYDDKEAEDLRRHLLAWSRKAAAIFRDEEY